MLRRVIPQLMSEAIPKRWVAFCLAWSPICLLLPLRAEEPPHLEFVQELRARGMADLALQYLQRISRNPPAEIAAVLPLELAKTRLELAVNESDVGKRTALYLQARAEFETFAKSNPGHPLRTEAVLEMARISALLGRTGLSRALASESRDAQRAGALRAREQFQAADQQLQAARAQIDAQLASLADESVSRALKQARLQAELEQGINLLDQARTYTEENEAGKRGDFLKRAIETLHRLSKRDDRNSVCWLARAWSGRCQQINDDVKAARAVYKEVIAETGEYAEAARRLARYFRLRALAGDPDVKKPLLEIQKAAEEWLTLYPNFTSTPEGAGVRFELANAMVKQVLALPKPQQETRQAQEVLARALKLFQSLEQNQNEFTAEAHESKLKIVLAVSQGRAKGDIAKLKNFEECYLRAQVEIALMNQEGQKLPAAQAETKRNERFKNLLLALNRGIDLADAKVAAGELSDARCLRTYASLATGDYRRAAETGEEQARTDMQSPQAPMAGAYALRAYTLLLGAAEQAGGNREDIEQLRGRLRSLAHFIEQTWTTDPAADVARHVSGLVFLGEKNYPEAVEVLERITPGYADATRASYQLAGAALQAQKEGAKPVAGKPSYRDRALAALLRMPELSSTADAAALRDYVAARLMLADIYYQTAQFEKMEPIAESLAIRLQSFDAKTKAEYGVSVLAITLYARLGRAEADYAAGRYAQVRELLDPIAKQVEDPALADQWSHLKDKHPHILRSLLGLALRANVQDSHLERGRALLELLQRIFPQDSSEILVGFVQQLKEQIEQLRYQGEAARPQLERTVASFSLFLEQLGQQQEQNPKADVLLFLAQSFSSLDRHARAAELAGKVPEPKAAEAKGEADPKQSSLYHAARLLHARELRLSREFAQADAALKAIQAEPWGQASIEAKKERIFFLEDQEIYAGKDGAIPAWNNLMRQMKPKLQDNKIKEQYFDCYYHFTLCLYKNALKMPNAQAKDKSVRSAANYIVRLEEQADAAAEPCKKRFAELLKAEPLLREKHDELQKNPGK